MATSLSVPSPDASHIACLSGARLEIRSLATLDIVRSIAIPNSQDVRNSRLAWSPLSKASDTADQDESTAWRSNRALVFDDDTTRVYDVRDEKWSAVISNGSGGMGKNVHVEFGATEDEVVVWSDFAACVKIWCLRTGRAVEIRDPKFPGKENRGWAYRPSTRAGHGHGRGQVLALLCRSSGIDLLLLLAARTYTLLSRVELPTADAANLRWSRDGRWLAIWDAASAGYSLHVYTADGHLYRTMAREPCDDMDAWGIQGLGIKSVEWIPGNEKLAVGGWDRRVRILSTRTFAPLVFLDHTPIIHVPDAPVYTEHMDGQGHGSYMLTPQPATPPKAVLEKNESARMKQGISLIAVNADGTLCATRDDSTPSTVWIWDLARLAPRTILIQYAPIKSLQWHPHHPSHLLIHTTHDAPLIYLYTAQPLDAPSSPFVQHAPPPTILALQTHLPNPAGPCPPTRWTTSWLATPPNAKPVLTLAHGQGYVVVWPHGKDQRFQRREDEEEESDDSLYHILTGRTPVPRQDDQGEGEGRRESMGSVSALDDTFGAKRGRGGASHVPVVVGLSESGVDEIF
ncbi:hypothetical protein ACEQ8H_006404 [Pleosporales sp. CAS-2024a]